MQELFINYFTKLFLVCVGAVICEIICESTSENKNTVFSAVRIVCSLCICLTVFSVFFEKDIFIGEALKLKDELTVNTSSTKKSESVQYLIENTKSELERKMSDIIFSKTGIKPKDISIQLNIESKEGQIEIDIENTYLKMPGKLSETDIYSAKKCIYDTLGCESVIEGEQKGEE